MIVFQILEERGIVIVEPRGPLSVDDFEQLNSELERHLVREGKLHGLLVHVEKFPGWKDFGSMISHFRFVRDHHRQIERVALVSDSILADILPTLAGQFSSAEVEAFDYGDRDEALAWLESQPRRDTR